MSSEWRLCGCLLIPGFALRIRIALRSITLKRPSIFIAACLSLLVVASSPQESRGQVLGSSGIHDPSRILEEDGRYYTFYTGSGINSKYSDDLITWQNGPDIFDTPPAWIDVVVPRPSRNENDFWAPSLLYYNNEYRVYYSASLFGSQTSAIGFVTNTTLDFTDPDYEWVDQGMVLNSEGSFQYPYNAIDPSVFVDNENRMWMTFGSFWDGIFIAELDPSDGKPISSQPNLDSTNLARNPTSPAIEAPYIHYRDGYYYLFVNWNSCCQGVDSTYEIRVGRSTSPTGPFFDQGPNPTNMLAGGGTLFLGTEGTKIGPGHMGIFSEDGVDYFGYHFYDGTTGGTSRYEVERLFWSADGWPMPFSDFQKIDLNNDNLVDLADWSIFQANHLTDLSIYNVNEQAMRGDLDGDGDNDYYDFRLFQEYYDEVQGAGAFAEALASVVPEPASNALIFIALWMVSRRNLRGRFSASAV